jgi:hypothetical protein
VDHKERSDSERKQVILKAFTLLRAGPIHEEPERAMHHGNGDYHIHCDPERGDSGEEPQNQSQTAKKLSGDREEG